jgi:hypothetical protein
LHKPKHDDHATLLHPGEPLFERLRELLCARFARDALRGGVFIAYAPRPYFFHLALVQVIRKADSNFEAFGADAPAEYRLVGMRQEEGGQIEECPVESLLLLHGANEGIGGGVPLAVRTFANTVGAACEHAEAYALQGIARPIADRHRQALLDSLPEREGFITSGYRYEEDQLLAQRVMKAAQAREGDAKAAVELSAIRDRQRALETLKEQALATIHREPELIAPGEVQFLAHALVVPSTDPEDRRRHDDEIEKIAVRIASEYEREQGWVARDVSTPPLARAAGLSDNPGFDILSNRPAFGATSAKSTILDERAIEVKGRAGVGDIELTENEWSRSCNLRDRYWLYVVFDCGSSSPRLLRVQDPFRKLVTTAKGGVIIDEGEIIRAADDR